MAVRFRKSVKLGPGVKLNFSKRGISTTLGPRGCTTSFGKRGVYQNVGIPGTGLSYRTKIAGGGSGKRKTNKSTSNGSHKSAELPKAVREWQAYTGKQNPGVALHMDEYGEITFRDESGIEITDPTLISIIKRTNQYKEQIAQLKVQQINEVAHKVQQMQQDDAAFVEIYLQSPTVLKRPYYEAQLNRLEPMRYEPKAFPTPMPTQETITTALSREADRNVKGAPWKLRKLREEYFNAHYQERFTAAMAQWQTEKDAFDRSEIETAKQRNAEYQAEYELLKRSFEGALRGDADYIESAAEEWIAECELPVEIGTQFEYRENDHCLMVDLDLPEIEDLPTEVASQLANGNIKIKEKTQKALRAEYASCVFGLVIFVAANLFNTSPEIERITISGYTQRNNKDGYAVNDYILSTRFVREKFYCLDYSAIDPEEFCQRFENRCKLTVTKIFKTIEPFEE